MSWHSSTTATSYSRLTLTISTVQDVCRAPSSSVSSCPVLKLHGWYVYVNRLNLHVYRSASRETTKPNPTHHSDKTSI